MTAPPNLRTLLVLGRVSNVPTVWSNCLAGWILGGGGSWSRFALLGCGATLMYLGGMYLNDAFDAEFDGQHRRDRPIPSGSISHPLVWRIGFGLLGGGLLCLMALGWSALISALLLAASILVYDAIHKYVTFSPVIMAACRFFLYLTATAAAARGVTGLAMWSAIALACYIIGLSYIARKESTGVLVQRWPLILLAIPPALAWLVNDGLFRSNVWLLGSVFVLWTVRSLRSVWMEPRNIPHAVSGLLAGIVWVDLLAAAHVRPEVAAVFVGLFLASLLFQRFVPAT